MRWRFSFEHLNAKEKSASDNFGLLFLLESLHKVSDALVLPY